MFFFLQKPNYCAYDGNGHIYTLTTGSARKCDCDIPHDGCKSFGEQWTSSDCFKYECKRAGSSWIGAVVGAGNITFDFQWKKIIFNTYLSYRDILNLRRQNNR